jgi:hypothetical protein
MSIHQIQIDHQNMVVVVKKVLLLLPTMPWVHVIAYNVRSEVEQVQFAFS